MPFDEEIYAEIGRVAAEWARLEEGTRSALWMLASTADLPVMHEPSRVLMAGMPIQAQWDAIVVLLGTLPAADPEALQWFKEWRKKADNGLRVRRNEVVHSVWATDENDPEVTTLASDLGSRKARAAPRWNVVPRGKAEVAELAVEISEHRLELSIWTSQQFRRLWPPAQEAADHVPPEVPGVKRLDVTPEA